MDNLFSLYLDKMKQKIQMGNQSGQPLHDTVLNVWSLPACLPACWRILHFGD
jgi:hypothetical protein